MYRKFKAERLFDGYRFLPADTVLIMDEKETVQALLPSADAGEDVQYVEGILTPGLINCHCHLELSHMKDVIEEGTGLVDFVQAVMKKRFLLPQDISSEAVKEDLLHKITVAEKEMHDNGIVAVGDICNTADSLATKLSSKIHWHNFIEVSGFVDAVAAKRLGDAKMIAEKFEEAGFADRTTLSPHAPYSVSKTLFQLLNSATQDKLITIHNQESVEEDKLYQDKTGRFLELYKNFGIDITPFTPTKKTSLRSWMPYFTGRQQMILVHDTFIDEADVQFANNYGAEMPFYCLCPNANLYIEKALPPVETLMKNGCNIVLGTDSYASNHQLSIADEIHAIRKNFPLIPLETTLQWATINGAKALKMDDKLGSFEVGKRPGTANLILDGNRFASTKIK